jgi:ADP-heptose:LPS heptosyltransferase
MREWPLSNWAQLGKNVLEQGIGVLITGGPEDVSSCQQLSALMDGGEYVQITAGNFSLPESATAIQGALCTVAVNTGIMHLSAALGTPTISLNGPTNSLRWGGRGAHVVNISVPQHDGGAYLNLGFEYPANPDYVMNKISVEEVKRALMERLHFLV